MKADPLAPLGSSVPDTADAAHAAAREARGADDGARTLSVAQPGDHASRRLAVAAGIAALVIAAALLAGSGGWDMDLLVKLRVPRVLAASGVGALLALAGLAMQVLLRNPLADPYVLGTSGGAAVGALLALMLGFSLWVGAGGGALAAGVVLLALARRALESSDDASPRLVLVGAMLASLFGAAATLLLMLTPDDRLRGAIFWLVGDLSAARDGGLCLLGAAGFAGWFGWRAQSLDRLLMGTEAAAMLGEPVRRLRLELLVLAALAVGLAVATAGAIGFVGLVVPQALRLCGVQRMAELVRLSAMSGAALVVAADLLARLVAAPMELPVGAIMALVGAPSFIVLLLRGTR